MPALFVTFEGGEGTGKSTQIERLAAHLRERGLDPLVVREPGGTPIAERLRQIILDPADPRPGPRAEALLLEAARADLVDRIVEPALAQGRVVLCDRYDDSTLAYQGGGRGLDHDALVQLNRFATAGLRPDVTFLFDLDPTEGLERRKGAGGANRLDREPEAFHARVRARFLELARQEPDRFVVLDAQRQAEDLEREIRDIVEARLASRREGSRSAML